MVRQPVNRQVVVYTPPGYSPNYSYPVLYLLHGRGGDQTDWSNYGNVRNILDNLLNAKQIKPMIVVMPDNHGSAESEDDEDEDEIEEAYLRFETELLTELIPFIDYHFPTIPTPQGRAIAGLSEGAEQSLAFGLANLDVFSGVGAFSPGADLVGGHPDDFIPDELYADGGPLPALLWLSCGASDTSHLDVTDKIGKAVDGVAMDENGQPQYGTLLNTSLLKCRGVEANGMSFYWRIFYADGNPDHTDGHDWNVWKASLRHFLIRWGGN